jgi:hypothetical protein
MTEVALVQQVDLQTLHGRVANHPLRRKKVPHRHRPDCDKNMRLSRVNRRDPLHELNVRLCKIRDEPVVTRNVFRTDPENTSNGRLLYGELITSTPLASSNHSGIRASRSSRG